MVVVIPARQYGRKETNVRYRHGRLTCRECGRRVAVIWEELRNGRLGAWLVDHSDVDYDETCGGSGTYMGAMAAWRWAIVRSRWSGGGNVA